MKSSPKHNNALLAAFALLALLPETASAAYPQTLYVLTTNSSTTASGPEDRLASVVWNGSGTGTESAVVSGTPLLNPMGVAYDVANSKAYIADGPTGGGNHVIYRVDLAATPVTLTAIYSQPSASYGNVRDIKMDFGTGTLYVLYSDSATATTSVNDKLVSMDTDGNNVTVVASSITNQCSKLALDINNNAAYVCDTSTSSRKIFKLNLAAAPVTVSTYVDLSVLAINPAAMAVDFVNSYLYFMCVDGSGSTSGSGDGLFRVTLSESSTVTNPTAVNTGGSVLAANQGLAIDLANNMAYTVDSINKMTWGLALTGGAQFAIGAPSGTVSTMREVAIANVPVLPTVITPASAAVTATTASLGGSVTHNGNGIITERGIVYSATATNANPLINGTGVIKVSTPGTNGTFVIPVSSLAGGTDYSFKAYATNGAGTTYTSVATFTTQAAPSNPPTITTPTSASITGTAATLGGNVTSDGGSAITERGVVYSVTSTNSNPQINGTGVTKVGTTGTTGFFTLSSVILTPGTAYSFAAYATNSVGTSYSSVGTFTTLSDNANLNNLAMSSGTLSPAFDSVAISYSAAVLRSINSVTVTPTAAENHANIQVRINGGSYAGVTSDTASGILPLNLGANTIDVLVTAQDGTTIKTYTIMLTRWTYLQGWRNQYFNIIDNSGNAADTVTPQYDGIANLMKFALGMNPAVPGLQPVTFVKNGSTLEFSYPRSVEATVECTFIVEWSDTLMPGSWGTAGVNEQILSDNGTLQQVKASLPAGNPVRRFVRLRVTNP